VIVIGVGNRFRGDDAVGLKVVQRLGGAVRCFESDGDPSNLIVLFGSDPDVVVVDAMASGTVPGTVSTIEIAIGYDRPIQVPLRSQSSTHGFGVFEALELARILGTVPDRLTVIGIEGADFSPGTDLSPQLESAVERVTDLILQLAAAAEAV
jgi:hydrogenase maturation protease